MRIAASRSRLASSSNKPFETSALISLVAANPAPLQKQSVNTRERIALTRIFMFIIVLNLRGELCLCGPQGLSWFCKMFGCVSAFFGRFEFVPDTMHGFDPARLVGVHLDFTAQARDMGVYGPSCGKGRVTPDNVQESLARDRFARGFGHEPKHGKFLGGEVRG